MSQHRTASSAWASLATLAMALLCALAPGVAGAGRVDTLKVPETMPDLPYTNPFPELLDPAPLHSGWASGEDRPLGVDLNNYDLTTAQIEAAQHTGCRMVRLAIPMEHFLADEEQDWAVLDQVISRLKRAGFEILPMLDAQNPVPEFYREFASAVAARYAQTFTYYQLLDNINIKIGMTSKEYADLISLTRTALIAADPDAQVVSGGIRGVDLTYLDMLENQGAVRSIDVFAFSLSPAADGIETVHRGNGYEHSLPYLEKALDWADSRGKRVWVTSLGVSTCYSMTGVDQATQASLYARGALYLGHIGVEHIFFAAIQDNDPTFTKPAGCCGLLDVTGQPKASYYALQALNYAIKGAYHVAPPCLYQGFVYRLPDPAALLITSEEYGAQGAEALLQYQVHSEQVYGFWFYAPESKTYTLIYWQARESRYPMLLTLNLGHYALNPLERYILLDSAPSAVASIRAQNFISLPYMPLSALPGVIRFEVNEDGRG